MRAKAIDLPTFENEDQEAKWWADNPEFILQQFEKAAAEGRLTRGAVARRAIPTTTIRLNPDDIALAKTQAERRGLRYQTYLKMLIHEALRKEAKATR
jgi:predicted DNA binding CopG/RHH family protein